MDSLIISLNSRAISIGCKPCLFNLGFEITMKALNNVTFFVIIYYNIYYACATRYNSMLQTILNMKSHWDIIKWIILDTFAIVYNIIKQ